MTDEQSLSARLAVDLDAHFEEMVRRFQDRLFGFVLRLTGRPADAEEALQDTFIRAYRALQRYPSDRVLTLRLRAWLYQIALNVVRNRVRRPTLAAVTLDESVNPSAAQEEQPEHVLAGKESRADLASALRNLPERYATAVILRHVQGFSYAEVAQILGEPVGTTKSDVYRGLRLLREALQATREYL